MALVLVLKVGICCKVSALKKTRECSIIGEAFMD